jgi:hypothetical protein
MVERNVTADERVAEPRGITVRIDGKRGIGKTALLWTVPDRSALFLDPAGRAGAEHGEQSSAVPPLTEGPR